MDKGWRIEMFGGLAARHGERVITRYRTQKTGALLAYLAWHRGRRHAREALIDLLWPHAGPRDGRNSLSVALSSLRRQMDLPSMPAGTVIIADRSSVQLNPASVETDVAEFEDALRRARTGSAADRVRDLREAVQQYRGEFLAGYYEDWVTLERLRLEELFVEAIHQLITCLRQSGEFDTALEQARRGVRLLPLQETIQRDLMELYAAAGRPTLALRHYREFARLLEEQLGTQPDEPTQQLARQIEAEEGAPRPSVAIPSSLPSLPSFNKGTRSPWAPPVGTVTFLVTEMRAGAASVGGLDVVQQEGARNGGWQVRGSAQATTLVFSRATDAFACAMTIQQALARRVGTADALGSPIRMALHTGEAEPIADSGRAHKLGPTDYHGPALDVARHLLLIAHDGQTVCSEVAAVLVRRDLEPGTRLSDLGVYRLEQNAQPMRIFQLEAPGIPRREFPPLKAEAGYAHTLPLHFTRFFGREKEMERLGEMLLEGGVRLVTLTGPGGSGKTRLALETARWLAEAFRGAVWFVSLADLSDPKLVLDTLLNALHLKPIAGVNPLEQVVGALSYRRALLVLDNLEHLIEAGAATVKALLEAAPKLACLVTSRQRLGLAAEHELQVRPLPVPAQASSPDQLVLNESVQLFVDRAQSVLPDFQITDSNAGAIAEICFRLEGIPLALELAAAWVQVLTPAQMLTHLENRFELLVSRRRDLIKRHRTLRAAIDWSYQLLEPDLQRFFARLSIFRGGWTLEAAEEVCEEPLALNYLSQLRECSLLSVDVEGEQARYRMLETLREYGWQRLQEQGELPALRTAHLRYFLSFARRAAIHLRDKWQQMWLARLDSELDNLRQALVWGLEADPEAALGLATAMSRFWEIRGYWAEGCQILQDALARASAPLDDIRPKALAWAGHLLYLQGEYQRAQELHQQSLAILRRTGHQAGIAHTLSNLGNVAPAQREL